MIERLKDLPNGIDGVKAIGTITKEDYEQVFVPLLDEARREGRRLFDFYISSGRNSKASPQAQPGKTRRLVFILYGFSTAAPS